MSWSDPIADMLTRIRNAQKAGLPEVEMPYSCLKGRIARVMREEGYISGFREEGEPHKVLILKLKYTEAREPAIRGVQRVSRPGLRKFCGWSEIPLVLNGMGTAIVSTSGGVMSGREARRKRFGGEFLCTIW